MRNSNEPDCDGVSEPDILINPSGSNERGTALTQDFALVALVVNSEPAKEHFL